MTRSIPSEAEEQKALFAWARMQEGRYPALALMYHIANGGSRNPIEAKHLKEQGVKPGIPDICLPVPARHHTALYIELKREKGGRVSEAQKRMLHELNKVGCLAVVAYGFEDAKRIILEYLRG